MTPADEEVVLERKVGETIVRVISQKGETVASLHSRLDRICNEIESLEKLSNARQQITEHLDLNRKQYKDTEITSDYHRVLISLLFNFDRCMGATDVSKEWGGINTGQVSRVFTGSRPSTEKYLGHFEKCEDGGYRFTSQGLEYALTEGAEEILSSKTDD